MEKKKHFVLVHGACHGAWCWYKVSTQLESKGHKVTAVDLAACGIHPKQFQELRSLSDYFEPLMNLMASLPQGERVILVGHSMGGFSISAAMERFPDKISVAVFCAAFMPSLDLTLTDLTEENERRLDSTMDTQYTSGDEPNNQPGSFLFGPIIMSSKLYQLSPPEDLTLAETLKRPHPLFSDKALLNKTAAVTEEKYGSVHRVYIVCEQDNVITQEFQKWMINKYSPEDVKVISGSDHMLMFSKPNELCCYLQQIADKYI